MSNLRNKLIRLAHQNPELRKDILPLLTEKVADKKDKNGLYPKDTIMVSKKGDEEIKIVDHKINQAMRAQQNKTQYDYVVQVLTGRRSGKEFSLTMNNMDSRYEPKFGKKAAKPIQVGDYFEDGDGSFYKVLEIKGKSIVTLRRTRGKQVDTFGQTSVLVPDDSGFIGKPYVGRIDGQGMVKAPFGGRKLFRWDGKPVETTDSQFK